MTERLQGLEGPPNVDPLVSPLEASKRAQNACEEPLRRFYGGADREQWQRDHREVVLRRRDTGVCFACGNPAPNPSRTFCDDCTRARSRSTYRQSARKAAGLCVVCGKVPPVIGAVRVTCDPCGKRRSARVLRSVEKRRQAGMCADCGKIPPASETARITCDDCGKKRSATVRRSRENRRRANEASHAC